MIPRAYKGAALLLAGLVLYSYGRCNGKASVKLDVQEEVIDRKLDSLQKDNHVKSDIAKKAERRADSLEKRTIPIKTKYITLRDTLVITDTVEVKVALSTADSVIALQDSTISTQKLAIGALKGLVSIRDESIRLLNQRNELAAKRIGRARREGFVVGFATAAFVVVTVKALK